LNSVTAAVAPSIGFAANSLAERGVGAIQGIDGPAVGPSVFAEIFGGLVAPLSPAQVPATDGSNVLSPQPTVETAQGSERGAPSISLPASAVTRQFCSLASVGEETETESDSDVGLVK